MSEHELGPLPAPEIEADTDGCTYACPEGYTADQMRAYALAEVRRAVEMERERWKNGAEALAAVWDEKSPLDGTVSHWLRRLASDYGSQPAVKPPASPSSPPSQAAADRA